MSSEVLGPRGNGPALGSTWTTLELERSSGSMLDEHMLILNVHEIQQRNDSRVLGQWRSVNLGSLGGLL